MKNVLGAGVQWTLDIAGLAALVVAGYLWVPAVGFAVAGLGLIGLSRLVEVARGNRNESDRRTTR